MDVDKLLGQTDIYLVDQIMKGRYGKEDIILDAGCGRGRNMHWFLLNGIKVYGIDSNNASVLQLTQDNTKVPGDRFRIESLDATSFTSDFFDHVILSAVLHFAETTAHFFSMMDEMIRVLKPGGSLFIRMASDIGMEHKVTRIGDGVYKIPDGSRRFLLTRSLLEQILQRYSLKFDEPFKTVNVEDIRCMSTLVFLKPE